MLLRNKTNMLFSLNLMILIFISDISVLVAQIETSPSTLSKWLTPSSFPGPEASTNSPFTSTASSNTPGSQATVTPTTLTVPSTSLSSSSTETPRIDWRILEKEVLTSLEDRLAGIYRALSEALVNLKILQKYYENERVRSVRLQHWPSLPDFPNIPPVTRDALKINIASLETHQYVLTTLSEAAMFFEAITKDIGKYEQNSGILKDLAELSSNILQRLILKMKYLIQSLGHREENIERPLSETVRDELYRTIEKAGYRHVRDYVIIRDTAHLYRSLIEIYSKPYEV